MTNTRNNISNYTVSFTIFCTKNKSKIDVWLREYSNNDLWLGKVLVSTSKAVCWTRWWYMMRKSFFFKGFGRKFHIKTFIHSDIFIFKWQEADVAFPGRFCSERQWVPDDKDTEDDPWLPLQSRAGSGFYCACLLRV